MLKPYISRDTKSKDDETQIHEKNNEMIPEEHEIDDFGLSAALMGLVEESDNESDDQNDEVTTSV